MHGNDGAQAARLVASWPIELSNDKEIGDFLLLLETLTYEMDATARENIYLAIKAQVMPHSPSVATACHKLVDTRRAELLRESEA